jgi:hydroxymethylbilane synthase
VKPLRIGTRGSMLALWQANHVRERLAQLHGIEAELVRIRTSGDNFATASIAQISSQLGVESGLKGVFIKEIEDALLAGTVDLAVHSMKDVPTEVPAALAFAAITKREDARDCLISRNGRSLQHLPPGARIGTSSLRRQAQLLHFRSDLELADLRGNVDTRLKKLAGGDFDAIVLAMAGVNRLGASGQITQVLGMEMMLPAVGQGALGIETRADDRETAQLAASLDDTETRACVTAERALLRELEGGCQVPLGAYARQHGEEVILEAAVFSPDGKEFVRGEVRDKVRGSATGAEEIGYRLARNLIERGADRILRLAGRSTAQG